MTIEQLREALTKTPFKPFTIRLVDGRSIRVPSPEFIMAIPSAVRTFVVGVSDDVYSVIDLLYVTSLDFGPNSTNGKGRSRKNPKHNGR